MHKQRTDIGRAVFRNRFGLLALCTTLLAFSVGADARPVTVKVRAENLEGPEIGVGFRWVLQEDVTYESMPGAPNYEPGVGDQLSTNLHKSHLPVVESGHCAVSVTCSVTVDDDNKRYYLSVLPDLPAGVDEDTCQTTRTCYTMSGKQILADTLQTTLNVVVTSQPLPTAQIYIMAHADIAPINNAWDALEFEPGLGGFDVIIADFSGGILSADNYGNPLGTRYKLAADGLTPEIEFLGDGTIHTMTEEEVGDPLRNPYGLRVGEALVKNLAPGKYAVNVEIPQGSNWQQTSTIEGTKTIDAWVKAGEPRFYSEFARRGPIGHHATFGFVRPEAFEPLTGSGSISGQNMSMGFRRVPDAGFDLKPPTGASPCYIGLNDQNNILQGIYAGSCNDDDSFTIENVPPGNYLVMVFDRYLGNIFNAKSVTVGDGTDPEVPQDVDLGEFGTFRWFSTLEQWSFYDDNEDGMWQRDVETPLLEQATILRYRDGSIYQASATDFGGFVPFDEIFPWFNWLVAEVDFARFKHTGTTVTVENGGTPLAGPIGEGKRNPQIQNPDDGGTNCDMLNGTGQTGCLTRTETGPALLEGYNHFLGFNSRIEWGKKEWEEGENGGLSGVVYYATTRAEDDVRFAAAEPWEPGIPRVQVNLYRSDSEGNID
ncbi:MAG: hypothetical protein GY949_16785, partial [Gammaproteobacteria bacterium]|nr:hypothetical protein [Gammaproteobacteria bacterium]